LKLDHVVDILLESLKDDQYIEAVFLRGSIDMIHIDLFTVTPSEISNKDVNQLCLGIIASGIGFVLAQSTRFRFLDIRRRL
jgi:hypothetical protein